MALIPCPECKREISSAAPACPHCGFPNPATAAPPVPAAPTGPACYACAAPATTRCVKCGALSCAVHVQNIFVKGDGGGNEIRCRTCFDSAVASNWWSVVSGIIIFAIFLIVSVVLVSRR